MSPLVRILIGVVTVAVFVFIGGTMLVEGQHLLGGILMALGLLRGVVLVQQMLAARDRAEDD